jgi:HK97 family phage prohead protease
MKFLTHNANVKSINEKGEISGYASVFNVIDGHNDVVLRGAFAAAIRNSRSGRKPKLLWQHDLNVPIGVIDDLYEDDHGLFIKVRLILDIPKAREIYSLLKNRAIDGFSIGYKIKDSYFDGNIQYLVEIDLLEVSIVTFPTCEEATIEDVKASENTKLPCNDNLRDNGASEEAFQHIELIKSISNKIKNVTKGTIYE